MSQRALQECQVGDVGVQLIVEFLDAEGDPLYLSTATDFKIRLGKPDGTGLEEDASLLTDGADGKIVYATVEDDLDQHGTWTIQGSADVAGGTKRTALGSFEVVANTEDPAE